MHSYQIPKWSANKEELCRRSFQFQATGFPKGLHHKSRIILNTLIIQNFLSLDSESTLREVGSTLLLTLGDQVLLRLRQSTTNSTSFLRTQILGNVLLSRELSTCISLHLLVVDGVNTSDVLSNDVDFGQLGGSSSSGLGNSQLTELVTEIIKLLEHLLARLVTKLESLDLHFLVPIKMRSP